MKRALLAGTAIALLQGVPAQATETTTYSYDAQGRLINTATSGTVNNGNSARTAYDMVHNRYHYSSSLNGAALPPLPPPPPPIIPPPLPTNLPPVANSDTTTMAVCAFKNLVVTTNDTDPEGHLPLTVISASPLSGAISVSVLNSTTIRLESFDTTGPQSVQYTITDSLGATGVGIVSVGVGGGVCN
jgi:YD repeat-containing protein